MKTAIPPTNYLTQAWSLDELNKLYRTLARQFHPDLGGDLAAMQALNWELEYRRQQLARPPNQTRHGPGRRTRAKSNKKSTGISPAAQRAYEKVVATCDGVQLKIEAGRVIVFGPETFHHREKLKSYGFWWEPAGKYWFFVRTPKKAGVL